MGCKEHQGQQQEQQQVLAENKLVGDVAICSCGTIHLSLGAVSLRLSPEVFGEAVTMMRRALQNLLQQGAALEAANEMVH